MSNEKPGFNVGGRKTKVEQPEPNTGYSYDTQGQPEPNMWDRLAGLGRVTATGSRSSKVPKEVEEVLREAADRTLNKSGYIKLETLVVEDPTINIPAVILYRVEDGVVNVVPLLLEAIARPLDPIIETLPGGRTIEIDRPIIRYYDKVDMIPVVKRAVQLDAAARGFGENLQVETAACIVIGKNIDLTSVDKVAPFYDSAGSAIMGSILMSRGLPTSELTEQYLDGRVCQLVARTEVHPGETYLTATGDPIAGDFAVNLIAKSINRKRQYSLHNTGNDVMLSSSVGFIDFGFSGAQQNMNQQLYGQQMPVPGYDPMVVITDISPLGKAVESTDTLMSQILGLLSVSEILTDFKWATVFSRAAGDSGSKTTIGALGLEYNLYPGRQFTSETLKVSTGDLAAPNPDELTPMQVITSYCKPTMVVALDVVQGGPLEWLQGLFINAFPGSASEDIIIKELDNFSNGRFSAIWNRSEPITVMRPVQVHLGTYVDNDGVTRDIRSLDYLTVLKLSQGAENIMRPYAEGSSPLTSNDETFDAKRRALKQLVPNMEITGRATRTFINPGFISAINHMMAECNLHVTSEGLTEIQGSTARTDMFNHQVAAQINSHSVFQHYGSNQNAVNGYSNTGYQTWNKYK